MSAKRNLLLGILALQNNFINRAQLLAGFNAWVEDKTKALGILLLEQKALSPEQHALLEALTAAHLRQHGDDADRRLAALSSAGAEPASRNQGDQGEARRQRRGPLAFLAQAADD
jgi:hypothetical protein